MEERYAALLARVIVLSVRDVKKRRPEAPAALAFLQEATPWAVELGMCPVQFESTVESLAREYARD
jgi:hypothetical protein